MTVLDEVDDLSSASKHEQRPLSNQLLNLPDRWQKAMQMCGWRIARVARRGGSKRDGDGRRTHGVTRRADGDTQSNAASPWKSPDSQVKNLAGSDARVRCATRG